MGLYRRKNSPIWHMSFCVNNRQYQRSTGTTDKRLADAILAKVKTQIVEGKWFEKEIRQEHTFGELAEKYLDWCKGRQRSYDVKKCIIPFLVKRYGDMDISMIDSRVIEQLQTDYLRDNYTPAYINKITAICKHMLTKATDWDMITEATLKAVRKVKPLKGENKRLRYLTKEEIPSLINSCDSHLKPIVIAALHTGMRKSEILNLKWDNVDLRHGFISLNQSQTKNAERKEIPINSTLRAVFQAITRRLDMPYVFYNPATSSLYQKDLKKSFATALKKAGITDFHFHDLRHTFASQLVMAGVDITTVKKLLGHKTLTMTLRYSHLATSHKVKAMEIYDQKVNCYNFATVGG